MRILEESVHLFSGPKPFRSVPKGFSCDPLSYSCTQGDRHSGLFSSKDVIQRVSDFFWFLKAPWCERCLFPLTRLNISGSYGFISFAHRPPLFCVRSEILIRNILSLLEALQGVFHAYCHAIEQAKQGQYAS